MGEAEMPTLISLEVTKGHIFPLTGACGSSFLLGVVAELQKTLHRGQIFRGPRHPPVPVDLQATCSLRFCSFLS